MNHKALLIPYNSQKEIFLQDRRGHRPPEWGFFGGGVDAGETALQAVLRETKEELDLDLSESDLEYLGEFPTEFNGVPTNRSMYLYRTDQDKFTVLEGAGGHWLGAGGVAKRLDEAEQLDKIIAAIEALSPAE